MRTTTYRGIGNRKQPDCAFQPRSPRPDLADWPTLVVECGVSQSLPDLRRDSNWWFTNSAAQVKTVLLFSLSEKKRKIHIEQWEMREEVKCIRTIDIVEADAAGASLQLSFEHLFLRKPSKGETDIVFSTEDLEELGDYVWSSPGCCPSEGAPTGLPSGPSGSSGSSGASCASLSSRWVSKSALGERLRSKKVTVGSYSPLPISHSPTVPSVFTRHLHSSPIAWRARPLPLGPANCLKVPTHPPRPVIRSYAKIPVSPGRPFRYWALGNTAYLGWRLLAAQL